MLCRKNVSAVIFAGKLWDLHKQFSNLCSRNEHKLPSDYDDDLMTDH